jgi:hypothetical protein|nr:hypothetical protein [uncultured Flavobacterium sp.]
MTWLMVLLLTAYGLPIAAQQKTGKIQDVIDAIKESQYCLDADYHTDGQRIVWVKSYTRWVPHDLTVMKKEAPDILNFLNQAIAHNRMDVLEQLLPDYYRYHGGVKQFAEDIKNMK